MTDVRDFLREMDEVLDAMDEGAEVSAAFREALRKTTLELARNRKEQDALNDVTSAINKSFGSGIKGAVDDVVLNGGKFSDAIKSIGEGVINATYNAAITPVTSTLGDGLGGMLGSLFTGMFADGAAFSSGRVTPFAKGGVFDRPVMFPMRGGTGLMGEAGPEAIMPLSRGPDGRLGVRAQGGSNRPVQVTMNITTPDAEGFRRSQSQIAVQMNRALRKGNRNL